MPQSSGALMLGWASNGASWIPKHMLPLLAWLLAELVPDAVGGAERGEEHKQTSGKFSEEGALSGAELKSEGCPLQSSLAKDRTGRGHRNRGSHPNTPGWALAEGSMLLAFPKCPGRPPDPSPAWHLRPHPGHPFPPPSAP